MIETTVNGKQFYTNESGRGVFTPHRNGEKQLVGTNDAPRFTTKTQLNRYVRKHLEDEWGGDDPLPAGRPKSGTASGSLREGLSSPFPIMMAAAEQIIRAALREPKWKSVAARLGLHIRSLEDLRRDFPQIDEWREIERGDVDSD